MVFCWWRCGNIDTVCSKKNADAGYLTQLWNDAAFEKGIERTASTEFADEFQRPYFSGHWNCSVAWRLLEGCMHDWGKRT